MIAPPGGASAMYYTGPSEDFSRPGRTWYPTMGNTRFPLWGEVSICYHEGVPGHHLQVAQVRYLADRLTRFQRTARVVVGPRRRLGAVRRAADGRARLPGEPRLRTRDAACAGDARAVRVIVDIGMHLELAIPAGESYHSGERWTPELALPFVMERAMFPEQFMRSEVDRYLGIPGQAISYKVGERVWLECREDARARHGLGVRPQGLALLRPRISAPWVSTSSAPRWPGTRSRAVVRSAERCGARVPVRMRSAERSRRVTVAVWAGGC